MENKKLYVQIRINQETKNNWKKICSEKKISLTSLILNSVENRIMDDERRKVIAFIEKQDNIFRKVETNINQIARIVNAQKYISENEIKEFNNQLRIVNELKNNQNKIFHKIYSLIANDR